MIGAGTVINPIIKVVTTVAILAAVYFFIVKPSLDTTEKISSGITQIPQRDLREVQGMNAFFIIPTNWKTNMSEWMMDHPPLEKRLAALSEIAREMGRPVSG